MAKEASNNFTKRECKTEFDAVHPRFKPEENAEALKYQEENYFHCQQCNQFFAPTVTGLNTHFKEDMVKHRPCGSCFYCKGDVFEYTLNSRPKIYHSCMRTSHSEGETV